MKTILIVEDDSAVVNVISTLVMQETQCYPIVVPNGSAAMAITLDIKPDLLLLDHLLPDMNGLELYDELHGRQALQDIPALLLTARRVYADIQREIVTRHLVPVCKPFEAETLLTLIQQQLVM